MKGSKRGPGLRALSILFRPVDNHPFLPFFQLGRAMGSWDCAIDRIADHNGTMIFDFLFSLSFFMSMSKFWDDLIIYHITGYRIYYKRGVCINICRLWYYMEIIVSFYILFVSRWTFFSLTREFFSNLFSNYKGTFDSKIEGYNKFNLKISISIVILEFYI